MHLTDERVWDDPADELTVNTVEPFTGKEIPVRFYDPIQDTWQDSVVRQGDQFYRQFKKPGVRKWTMPGGVIIERLPS